VIRIAFTAAAFDAVAKTLPLGSVGYERENADAAEHRAASALSFLKERAIAPRTHAEDDDPACPCRRGWPGDRRERQRSSGGGGGAQKN
jgi:hypothetical protein